jgi:hypothetical protein
VPVVGGGGCRTSGSGGAGGIGGVGVESNAPRTVWVTVCTVEEMFVAMLDELTEFVWKTSPSFPGLRIRIEMAVLHISQDVGGGAGVSQVQFQIHVGAARSSGLIAGGVVLPSAEFHDQFQIQVEGRFGAELDADAPGVGVGAAGMSGVELIPPELPP